MGLCNVYWIEVDLCNIFLDLGGSVYYLLNCGEVMLYLFE